MSVRKTGVVFINGSFGVGKSSVLDHLGDLMQQAGDPFSLFDVDWFHRSWPPPPADPANREIEAANLSAVWRNYLSAGPRTAFVAGVFRSDEDRALYEQAFGMSLWSVRLRADEGVVAQRLQRRYSADRSYALQWHLRHHRELAQALDAADIDDATVDTDALSPFQVASRILALFEAHHAAG